MTSELPRLNVGISLDSALFVAEMQKVHGAIDKLGQNMAKQNKQMSQGVSTFTGALGAARTALSVFGVGLSVSAVTGFLKSTLNAADALKSAADAAGVSAEQLQEWRFAASQSGGSAEQMDGALQKLNQRLGDFVLDGTGPAAKAFETLGVATDISTGKLKGTGAVMDAVVAALAKIEEPAQRAALMADLFGREAGPKMASLLNEGVDGINKLREATTKLSNEQVARADEIGDAWDRVSQQIITRSQSVALTLADAFARGAENQQAVADSYSRMADDVIASVQRLAEGVDTFMGDRLDGALAGVQAKTQGATDAFKAMYDAVVGNLYVPDMVTEIQGWMERLAGPAMVDPANRAAEDTSSAFDGIFESTAQNLADTFGRTFENILQDGVTSFEDLADSVGKIFTNMTSSIGQTLGSSITALGAFGGPLGSLGGTALGVGAMFGIQKLSSALGLGGGPQSNKISPQGMLGVTAGGTGAGAQFVAGIDEQLVGLLDARSEALVNQALRAAPATRVQYSKQPSANDLANLARGRIGPAAAALGLNTGRIATGSAEQQFANLQTAIGLMRQFEGMRIGPVATQFRDLNEQFAELRAEADRLGVSTAGLAEEQARANQELSLAIQREFFGTAGAVGAMSDLNVQLHLLNLDMQQAAAAAQDLGVPLANVTQQHIRLAEALVRQNRAQEIAIEAQVGNISPLQTALEQLNLEMQDAYAAARLLGVSTANITREHLRLVDVLIQEHEAAERAREAQLDALALSITDPFERMLDPLRQFATSLTLGNLDPADQMQAAGDEFRRIAELARAGSTTAIDQLQGAGEAFISQMERFGASPGGAAARIEVQSVIEGVMADISQAQREASAGLEDTIRIAAQRQVDTLRELIEVGRTQIEEIKRLRR